MYRIGTIVLAVLLVGTTVWGFTERKKKEELYLQTENGYQRAFHDLAYYMDMLHDTIGTTLAMNSQEQLSPQMIEIWRLTSEAQSNIGQLPLGLLPFNKTEEFLSEIGNFSYATSARELDKEPLNKKEVQTLENLYKEAGEIKDELREVQHYVLKENLRWTDVELALSNGDEPKDNTIVDGFQTVEKKVAGFTEAHNDVGVLQIANKDHSFKYLKGKKINENEAIDKAAKLLNKKNKDKFKVATSRKGADVDVYTLESESKNRHSYVDLTQIGGHPLTIMIDRPIKETQLSLNDGEEIAEEYLENLQFDNMKLYQTNQFDRSGLYSFVSKQDGVRIYSDALEVKVALDDGEIIGLTARDYFMNHRKREIEKPKLSKEKALDKVNKAVTIEEDYLAIIDDEFGKERLVYEFIGTMNDDTYRIFIDANNGKEVKVERLTGTEAIIS